MCALTRKNASCCGKVMRIIRYLDPRDRVKYAFERSDGHVIELEGEILSGLRSLDRPANVRKILAPIAPSQILGIGLNYRRHAEETRAKIPDHPVLFGKGLNAVQNPGDPILIPTYLPSREVDYECELAVVIKKACKNVSQRDALRFVLGYTCANDVSARDWQKKKGGGQWSRGKSFDSFCPLGPCLVTADEIPDPNSLAIRTILNGETVQDCNTADMIFDVPALIEFLSGSTTLLGGTVILTGTPHGVGMAVLPPRWLAPGDIVSVEIEKIGILTNPVEAEPETRSGQLDT
jgi:2-keto-4-pentenoate hydratase/2-oxohepta-3-ene-1,7-dioic acid hydratase in catechol pathway